MTDDCDQELIETIGEVINEADDDRLPEDTIWYDDAETLAEAIARQVRDFTSKDTEENWISLEEAEKKYGMDGDADTDRGETSPSAREDLDSVQPSESVSAPKPAGYLGRVDSQHDDVIPVDAFIWPWETEDDHVRGIDEPLYAASDFKELLSDFLRERRKELYDNQKMPGERKTVRDHELKQTIDRLRAALDFNRKEEGI